MQGLITAVLEFVSENGEKYDAVLLQLARTLKALVEVVPQGSEVRQVVYERLDGVFEEKVRQSKRIRKREMMMESEETDGCGIVKIKAGDKHESLKQENQVLTEIMQNYYLIKNALRD